eukprot:scaffold15542_cov112-Isochrysis_galbana.AAC.7
MVALPKMKMPTEDQHPDAHRGSRKRTWAQGRALPVVNTCPHRKDAETHCWKMSCSGPAGRSEYVGMLEWSPESIWARPREAASGLQSISSVSSHSSDEPGSAWHLLNRQDLSLLFIRDVALIIACATT